MLGKPGPWGQLDYMTLYVDMPDEFVFVPGPNRPPVRWSFKDYSKEKVLEFFRSAGITPTQLDMLQKAVWKSEAGGITVTPGDEFILSLAPEARAKIYSLLVTFPENARQIDPVCFQPGQIDEHLKDSGLAPSSVDLLKGLLYSRGPSLFLFADFEPALRRLPSDEERRRFVQAVVRKKALLVRLRLDAASNLDSIINYWSVGGRKKDIAPLLKALRHEGDTKIQIICLLPPFVRERLHTFPLSTDGSATGVKQDCFWTAMNFFNEPPDNSASDTHSVETLNKEYYQILTPTQLGDTVFLTTPDGVPVHAAVYIADDIVFTKNGESFNQPWILMHMQDMIDEYVGKYAPSSPLKIFYYRKKSL